MKFSIQVQVLLPVLFAALITSSPIVHLQPRECYDGESSAQLCYRDPLGTPQDVELSDIQAVATYLRKYGRTNPRSPGFWTMRAADAPNCGEWSVYSSGTVLVTAKHINNNVNTSVLFTDIANTIDGGEFPTAASKAASLTGCGTDGGSLGVIVNTTEKAYSTTVYKASGFVSDGILLKLVHNV